MNLLENTAKELWEKQLKANPDCHQYIPDYLGIDAPKTIRDTLQENNPEVELIFLGELIFDEAIIGVQLHKDTMTGKEVKAVGYSQDKIIEINMSQGMDEQDAIEHFEYNQSGAYVGEQTPIFI